MNEWLQTLVEKIGGIPYWMWTTIVAIAILGALFLFLKGKNFTARTLSMGALCISLGFILSSITVFKLQNGGSITPGSMLPILAYAWAFGPTAGIASGIVYGCMQLIQGIYVVHPVQFALDYILPFAFLGFAGFSKKNLQWASVFGCLARFLSHFTSGIIFWGEYAPAGQPVALYSLLYNGSYMLPEMIICLVLSYVPQLKKIIETMNPKRITVSTVK